MFEKSEISVERNSVCNVIENWLSMTCTVWPATIPVTVLKCHHSNHGINKCFAWCVGSMASQYYLFDINVPSLL